MLAAHFYDRHRYGRVGIIPPNCLGDPSQVTSIHIVVPHMDGDGIVLCTYVAVLVFFLQALRWHCLSNFRKHKALVWKVM